MFAWNSNMITAVLTSMTFFLPLWFVGWILLRKNKEVFPSGWMFAGVVCLSLFVFWLWKWDSPPPNLLNWDIYEHQTLVNNLLSGRISLIPSHVSDTFQFNGYSTLFHLFIAVPQTIFNPDPMLFWWVAEWFHLITTIVLSYVLAFAVTRIKQVALLSAIIGAFVFESATAFTSLSLMPQTVAALLIVLLLAALFSSKKVPFWLYVLVVITAVLVHVLVGLAGTVLAVLTHILLRSNRVPKTASVVGISIAAALGIFFVSQPLVAALHLSGLNTGEAASFISDLPQKLHMFETFYGWSLFVLFPLGLVSVLRRGNKPEGIILALSLGMLGLVLSAFPYSLKLYTIGRYCVHVVMAIGVWSLIRNLPKIAQSMAIILIAACFIPAFVSNITQWKEPLLYKGRVTQMSDDERLAALFLKKKFEGKNVFLVSDPSTQYVLESVSGVNSQGGAYAKWVTRDALIRAFGAQSREEFLTPIYSVRDRVDQRKPDLYLFVYSGRSAAWIRANPSDRESIAFNVWVPKALSFRDLKETDKLSRIFGLSVIFQNADVVIFELPKESV